MDATNAWDEILTALGLQDPTAPDTLTVLVRAGIVTLVTLWLGGWVRKQIRLAAQKRDAYADIVSLLSRVVAGVIYVIGGAIVLGIAGVNPTAITTLLAAATIGSSLAVQDVARGFVNGVYIFIERPFKIGDHVRIGDIEGRVEEIGIRLTRLRRDDGERTVVPNSVVFASAIEKASSGDLDRQRFRISGIERPLLEIEPAIKEALKGAAHLSRRGPLVHILSAGPDGTAATVAVEYDLGHRIDATIISKLRAAFPEAVVTAGAAGDEA